MRLVGLVAVAACGSSGPPEQVRIDHVTIVSPERAEPLRDATVLIDAGRIAAILPGVTTDRRATRVIDGHGLFLVPGLIDAHVHLGLIAGMLPDQERAHPEIARAARAQIPRSFLAYGFTTLIDFNGTTATREQWNAQPVHPDFEFCGGAALDGGYPTTDIPPDLRDTFMPYRFDETGSGKRTPEAVVKRMHGDGAICVKTFFERGFGGHHDLPVPALADLRELEATARAYGMPLAIHANTTEAHEQAVDAGAQIVAHGLWNWSDDRATALPDRERAVLDREIAAGMGWEPTLQVLHALRDLFDPSYLADAELARVVPAALRAWYASPEGQSVRDETARGFANGEQARQIFDQVIAHAAVSTRYVATHGGHILFGTDTPSGLFYTNPPGLNGWREMQDLVAAGVTPAQLFHAATIDDARAFSIDNVVGTVEVGKRANLLLLAADPTVSIDAYRTLREVILRGRVIEPKDLVVE
ncbi:MAG TPA: amidohydrolase family protein [Kofleriaceae bacterium]|jgi:imidazolonepropionase-like amidohydrolase|nr:amidohydrolase family protein [Kofleriaceae bacterium]